MLVIKTNKTLIKSEYTGTPDTIIPRIIPTMEAYNKAEIGQEYTGYRRSNRLDLVSSIYSNLTGKIYQDSRI
jgi:hypothetical protein